jgi:hypothetical protein
MRSFMSLYQSPEVPIYAQPAPTYKQNSAATIAASSAQLEGSNLTRAKRQKLEAAVTELRTFFKSDKQLVQEQQHAPSPGAFAWLGTFKPTSLCITRTPHAQLARLLIAPIQSPRGMLVAIFLTHTASLYGACDAVD